jgi:hypothetical protein
MLWENHERPLNDVGETLPAHRSAVIEAARVEWRGA